MTDRSCFEGHALRRLARHGLAVVVAALAACGGDDVVVPTEAPLTASETRASQDLQGWTFVQDDTLTDTAALAADGTAWTPVTLPHTWNALDAASTEQTTPASVGYKRGLGWYRLEFTPPASGATQWLQFDGASITADVWLNGQKLGRHQGAFSTFRFDVTQLLVAGKNVLLVKTDNSAPANGAAPTAVIPLSGDFNMSGGLYRKVSLLSTTHKAHVALDDFGSSGVFARTQSVNGGTAALTVRTKLTNADSADGNFTVQAALLDATGTAVATTDKTVALAAGAGAETSQDLSVPAAHLWQGVADPYLYKLVVSVKDSGGSTLDKVVQDFGIREMRFDADNGFLLNNQPVKLHGVNLHQDYFHKGWAITEADVDESLGLIKEIGANTVRLAHYPHSAYTYAQADKLGLVVWAELPFVDRTLVPADCASGAGVPASLVANARQQLQELIRQQANHASVALWSVANEPAMGGTCQGVDTVTPLIRELHTLAKAEDPGRATTLADFNEDVPGLAPVFTPLATGGITDVWGVNRYYGWYYLNTGNTFGAQLDAFHAKYPGQPLGVSEYGAGAALTHQTDNPLGGYVGTFDMSGKRRTLYQPEGVANTVHEQNYPVMATRNFVWGSYVWAMFDFGSGTRHEGDIGGTNTKGLVSFDRKTKKDPFFFYKANWSTEPVTYITGRRYVDRAYAVADVKVYSNAASVTLKVNGSSVGSLTAAQCPWMVCVFSRVPLAAGANSVVAEGQHGTATVTDTVNWTLAADNQANVYIAAGQPATGFVSSTGHRYGSDNFFTAGIGAPLTRDSLVGPIYATSVANVSDPADRQLWAAVRTGNFSYDIPLADGNYTVTLGFLEPLKTATAGSRVFDVAANGSTQIAALDVFAAAGGHSRAVTRSFTTTVTGGRLLLDFKPSVGEAAVSNLTVTRN